MGDNASWTEVARYMHLNCGCGEKEHRGRWEEFRDAHGDWGRNVALYLGRHAEPVGLKELGEVAGGLGLAAASQARGRWPRGACGGNVCSPSALMVKIKDVTQM